MFINQLVNKEPDITLSEASGAKDVNISAMLAQWNNAGVNTDGTQATITRTDLRAISITVRKFVDDYRAKNSHNTQYHHNAAYPYKPL
ncbi:MAG: hypothetical protein RSA95_03130 [Citrobacter sp.]|uniref:hypothetical protein n=1 Tax=Citrobacter sp. TaxID=1896336 RepID=UPI002FCABC51